MTIRQESPQDYDKVYELVKASFATASHSDGTEADYLNKIRQKDTFISQLSLVVVDGDMITGQIVLYKMTIALPNETMTELVISPLSVHPGHFKKGIATTLVEAGLKKAKELGYKATFLCGDPVFYEKLGFTATHNYGIYHIKDNTAPWCMVKELEKGFLDKFSKTPATIDIE